MIAVLNRDTSGDLTSKSTQTKEDVADIDGDNAVGLKTDDDIFLTPNEKKGHVRKISVEESNV